MFHNLLQNAIDAQADARTPSYDIALGVNGDEVTLAFADAGAGFADDVLRRAFEPYVTTKAKGTGLGLAIVRKIVDEHHGRVDARQPRTARRARDARVSAQRRRTA